MPPQAIPGRGFGGGLNLTAQPYLLDDRFALDCLNIELDELGAVRQRQGYAQLTTAELTNQPANIERFETSAGARQLLVGCGTRLEAVNDAGAVVASAAGLTDAPWDFV